LKGFAKGHTIKAKNQTFDPKTFLLAVKQKALEKFQNQTKVRRVLKARMEKVSPTDGSSIVEIRNFQSKTAIVLESNNLDELWTELVEQILENIAVSQMNGSGWTFHSIVSLDIHTVKYKPLRGDTYIPLPKFLASKKALINMKFKSEKRRNEDVQCFKLCIARALNPVQDHPERITRQLEKHAETLNFHEISFPMKLKYIKKFEQQNPQISVNVLGYEDKKIFPLRVSEMAEREHDVNLLLLEDKHFILINDLSRFLSHQMSNHKEKGFFCLRCLNSFTKKEVLGKHKESCDKHDCVKLRMPIQNSIKSTNPLVSALILSVTGIN